MASSTAGPNRLIHHANSCLPHHLPRAASVTLSLFYMALLVFSALGNILALFLVYQKGKKINSTGVYLVHLAASDLLFTLVLPGKITYYTLDFNWPFGEGLCRLMAFMFYVNTHSGIYLMTCVSVDRYLAVVRTHQWPQLREAGRARLVCVAVWALASLQTRAFKLSLQLTVCLMNMNCSIDPIIYFFASTRYRNWLLGVLKRKASASSSSSCPGRASSETQSINQTGGSAPLEENEV
ncbi:G-protein coupled receptor 183 [Camelus ferus]|uniref:G-protein coupled receptor 183 n=2 Tax=Camelus TaxID=9836 RepID=A0A8B8UCA4_CAMFR|nr:G-protein coupled receptor 183-like [Camelus bactrianus]XP_032351917.1 G-protein coupled receptor 183 [Camelus ferus]